MADLMNMQPDEYKLLGKNFAPGRPYGIKSVTWHHMAGDLDADGCNRVWEKSGAAAHYSCDRNGWIVQHVHDMDRAYACGDGVGRGSAGSDKSVSIEVANDAAGPWTVHERALEACARLTGGALPVLRPRPPQVDGQRVPAQALQRHGLPRRAGGLAERPRHGARAALVRRDDRLGSA